MHDAMKPLIGKALTVTGPVEPEVLGKVMMHEHLYGDCNNWVPPMREKTRPEFRDLIVREGFPFIKKCNEYGCHAFVDATVMPGRADAAFYREAAEATGMHIILCTGFYREVELGTYWARKPEYQIWPYVREASVEQLAEYCVREIVEGIGGSSMRAGAIKLGSSGPVFTQAEEKAFRAGARAQKETGVHITTHCTNKVAAFAQLLLLDEEGVDLSRVAIGHIGWSLGEKAFREACIPWMKRGASILPTNLGIGDDGGERYRSLVDGIHRLFDAGVGDRLGLGLDSSFCDQMEDGIFRYDNVPPPPWLHMFTHTLPAFRKLGLTAEEEDWMMRRNPQRIIPVQKV